VGAAQERDGIGTALTPTRRSRPAWRAPSRAGPCAGRVLVVSHFFFESYLKPRIVSQGTEKGEGLRPDVVCTARTKNMRERERERLSCRFPIKNHSSSEREREIMINSTCAPTQPDTRRAQLRAVHAYAPCTPTRRARHASALRFEHEHGWLRTVHGSATLRAVHGSATRRTAG